MSCGHQYDRLRESSHALELNWQEVALQVDTHFCTPARLRLYEYQFLLLHMPCPSSQSGTYSHGEAPSVLYVSELTSSQRSENTTASMGLGRSGLWMLFRYVTCPCTHLPSPLHIRPKGHMSCR